MKTTWGAIIGFSAVFFASIQNELFAIFFLIGIDTITGIWSAIKEGGVKAFNSRKLGRIVKKMIIYPLAIIAVKITEDYLSSTIPWEDVVTGVLSAIEVTSILENMSKILGFDLIGKVKSAINNKFKKDKND